MVENRGEGGGEGWRGWGKVQVVGEEEAEEVD